MDAEHPAEGTPPAAPEAGAGSRIGPYLLETLIGEGGMGTVYRAYDTRRQRTVALKLMTPQVAADPTYRARFRREAETAARLTSPHIVPIHDYGEIDGRLFLDMQLVPGEDLGSLLADGPLPPESAVNIVEQLASALDDAHAAGLVHRDVKPANVLVVPRRGSRRDHAYLGDFGLAHAVDRPAGSVRTRTGTFIGTLDYAAPERISGEPVDHRADVYALGCLFYEMLAGRRPFVEEHTLALVTAHLTAVPPRAADVGAAVGPEVDAVIARAMAKDPRDRFASAGEMAEAARRALAQPAGKAEPVASSPARARRRRPARWMWIAVATTVVLVATTVVVLQLRAPRAGAGAPALQVLPTTTVAPPPPLRLSLAGPTSVPVGEKGVYTLEGDVDRVVRCEWTDPNGETFPNCNPLTVSYHSPGEYVVRLVATTDDGRSRTLSLNVRSAG